MAPTHAVATTEEQFQSASEGEGEGEDEVGLPERERWPGDEAADASGASSRRRWRTGQRSPLPQVVPQPEDDKSAEMSAESGRPFFDFEELSRKLMGEEVGEPPDVGDDEGAEATFPAEAWARAEPEQPGQPAAESREAWAGAEPEQTPGRQPATEAGEDAWASAEPEQPGQHAAEPGEAAPPEDAAASRVLGMDELLRNIDLDAKMDAIRLSANRAVAHGVPVLELESVDSLNGLLNRLDDLEKMTFSQLRGEYEKRGFATSDSLMSRSELLPHVRDALIWEALNVKGLVKVCFAEGVEGAHEGLSREALLRLLAEPSWRQYGIPTERFKDVSDAHTVLGSIRSLETRGRQDLVLQCRQYGLPVGDRPDSMLIEQLRKALVWVYFPEAELIEECRQLGVEPPPPALVAELGRTQKEALFRRLTSTFWKDWGPRLERLELTEAFVKQFERVDSMSLSSLQVEVSKLDLYVHPKMGEAELAALVKQALVWKHMIQTMPLSELRHECEAMAVEAGAEDDEVILLQSLLRKMALASWQKDDLAPSESSDYGTSVRIMESWQAIDCMTLGSLKTWYANLNFPHEHGVERQDLAEIAYKFSTWQELSLSDLKKECLREGMDLPEEDPEASEQSHKQVLVDALMCRNRMDAWDAKGFQASRIKDYQTAIQIVELFDRYQSQPTEDLKRLCLDAGLPREAVQDREKVLDTLKMLLVWELLPLEELREDCRVRDLPTDTSSQDQEEAHTELYQRLRVDLSVKMNKSTYEEKGVPVERLSSLAAANVFAQYESIEGQSAEELQQWYSGRLGFPEETAMTREELMKVAKLLGLWHELSLSELLVECEKYGVKPKEPPKESQGGDEHRHEIVNQLLYHERMETWEVRGFRSKAIGDIEKVMQVVGQCEAWQKMGQCGLKKALADAGYLDNKGAGHRVLYVMDRADLLKVLKAVLIWELLPMAELQKDCKQRQLVSLDGCSRDDCIRWLVRATFANTWSVRGVPAERLRSLEVAEEIISAVDKLQAAVTYHEMVGQGQKPLKDEYRRQRLPFDPKLDNQALIDRFRDLLVWNRLPMPELQRECRAHGISPDVEGFGATPSSSGLVPPTAFQGPPGALGRRPFQGMGTDHLRSRGKGATMPGMPFPKGMPGMPFPKGGKGSLLGNALGRGKGEKAVGAGGLEQGIAGLKSVKASEALGRMAQTKEAKEEEEKARRVLIERLVLHTWRSTWKPRGIPADRFPSLETAASLIAEIDRIEALSMEGLEAESAKQGVTFNRQCSLEVLRGRIRNIVIWQHMSEAELRRERRFLCRNEDLDFKDSNLHRGELMEQLLELSILLESEAQGIPVLKMPNLSQAFSAIEGIDQSGFESLRDWYEKLLNLPPEKCMERAELVRLAKLLCCWQELPIPELLKECEKYGVRMTEVLPLPGASEATVGEEARQPLTDALLLAERRRAWDARGYQATRIGDINCTFQLITSYEDYCGMSDQELRQFFAKMGFPCEGRDREECLRLMKIMLVWEYLSLDEVKKECEQKHLRIRQVVAEREGNDEELTSELVHLLKVDLRVEMNKDYFEQKGIPVGRLGSLGTARVESHMAQIEARATEELRNEYTASGFIVEEALDRQHILDTMKKMIIWEHLPLIELQRECLDRDLPLHVDVDPSQEPEEEDDMLSATDKRTPKHVELVHRLTIDLHVSENRRLYLQRGIPVSRLSSQKAYAVMMKFNEIDDYSIDQLRAAQQDFQMPPAPNMCKEELQSRLKDATIWREFSSEELQRECRIRNLTPLMPAVPVSGSQPNMREVLLDTLLLNRCARTYDELQVPYRQLRTAKAAVRVVLAWEDLDSMQLPELRFRYTTLGLSTNLLEPQEIKSRLRSVAVYLEIPMEDLHMLCAKAGLRYGGVDTRSDLVQRFVRMLWPPKVDPQPKPKPRPQPPPPPPPPPRPPSMATGRMRLAQYFQVLQLPPTAGIEEVKKAYRRLALKHHPDKNRGERDEKAAHQTFQKVAEAYEKLSEFFLDKGK